MKNTGILRTILTALVLILSLIVLFTACGDSESTTEAPESTTEAPDTTEKPTDDLRVIISSDIHYTYLQEWYGTSYNVRIQHWVDTIKKEHAENPIDLLVINGDISLDYWINGGSVIKNNQSTSKNFVKNFVSKLPDDIPVFIIPGNHEQYSDEDWLTITGNHREGHLLVGGRLFIFLDTFGGDLDPDYHHDGKYIGANVSYIEEVMAQNPNSDVYLIAHHFDTSKETSAFRTLVRTNDRIKGLFAGHTHKSAVIELGSAWGNKTVAQTGNFAYFKDSAKESFWGFRELIITDENAYSQYIIAESSAKVDGVKTDFARTLRAQVTYYGTAPELPKEPEKPDPLADYTTFYDKIDQSSVDGDVGMKETNRVQLALDNDITTKWCVRPTAKDGSVTMTWKMTEAITLEAYAISTANDALDRNPKAWTLYARNSETEEWTAISVITDGNLPKELRTVSDVFPIEKPAAYQYYKLTLTDNFNNRDLYQFSEFIMLKKK